MELLSLLERYTQLELAEASDRLGHYCHTWNVGQRVKYTATQEKKRRKLLTNEAAVRKVSTL